MSIQSYLFQGSLVEWLSSSKMPSLPVHLEQELDYYTVAYPWTTVYHVDIAAV